jgi:short-subunit dehydrogenase
VPTHVSPELDALTVSFTGITHLLGKALMRYQGRTALITGASGGLGEEFARQMAVLGASLVLVARSEDKLNLLAVSMREQSNTQVTVIPTDLFRDDEVR